MYHLALVVSELSVVYGHNGARAGRAAATQSTRAEQPSFVNEQGTRFWPRCTFQGLRNDPVDQFLFVFLGGQMQHPGVRPCDMWHEPERQNHCPCAAPSWLLGGNRTVVEIGANDGLHMSNSWFFEHYLGWRSLCIEANPMTYRRLVRNRPRCAKVNAVVGRSDGNPTQAPFISLSRPLGHYKPMAHRDWETGLSGIEGSGHKEINSLSAAERFARKSGFGLIANRTLLPLRPFADIFAEHNVRTVDVLFVDVEGAELGVLSSIDFSAVRIHIIMVEVVVQHTDSDKRKGLDSQALGQYGASIAAFLDARGYERVSAVTFAWDSIFISKSYLASAGASAWVRERAWIGQGGAARP